MLSSILVIVLALKLELLEVIEKCPEPCFTIPLIRENRFNPFDSVPLANPRFELS